MKRQMSKETYEKLLLSNIRYQKTDKGKEAVKKAVKKYRINKQNEANNNGIRSNECKNKRNIL